MKSIPFTPLGSPDIYAGDVINIKLQLLIEGGVKAPSFLTGFTFSLEKLLEDISLEEFFRLRELCLIQN